jgi:hypothetical protein
LEKFGDGKPLEVLVMDISNLKMNAKEKFKDFNQRFLTLKNRIPADSMPARESCNSLLYKSSTPKYSYLGEKIQKGHIGRSL